MQHIDKGRGILQVNSILYFVFDVLELFVSLKWYLKINQGIQILQL